MTLYVLICTLIGWLCGVPVLGLLVGLLLISLPKAIAAYDLAAARRRRRRRRR